jgi:hypothetical protein
MNSILKAPRRGCPLRIAAAALTIILTGAGCAATPPAPAASLQAARQAISAADRADARRHAAAELSQARTKHSSADEAVTVRKMTLVGRLAIESSRASAELASAKTAAAMVRRVNEEMMDGNDALIEEMRRNSAGDKP